MEVLPLTDTTRSMRMPHSLRRIVAVVLHWYARRRQRIDLAGLDDRLLADIGVSAAEARRESSRPFWR